VTTSSSTPGQFQGADHILEVAVTSNMSGVEKHEITSIKSKNLLKEIQDELPQSNQQPEDSRGNRMYGPSEGLDSKVKDLLASLELGVRGDTSSKIRQPLKISSI
jgi:hypothetical protein